MSYLSGSAWPLYENPSGVKTFVKGLMFHNTNTGIETVNVHWVPSNAGSLGSASTGNRFAKVDLFTSETLFFEIPFSMVLEDQKESIQALATNGGKVTSSIFGDIDS
jgi:hypothetical protein